MANQLVGSLVRTTSFPAPCEGGAPQKRTNHKHKKKTDVFIPLQARLQRERLRNLFSPPKERDANPPTTAVRQVALRAFKIIPICPEAERNYPLLDSISRVARKWEGSPRPWPSEEGATRRPVPMLSTRGGGREGGDYPV